MTGTNLVAQARGPAYAIRATDGSRLRLGVVRVPARADWAGRRGNHRGRHRRVPPGFARRSGPPSGRPRCRFLPRHPLLVATPVTAHRCGWAVGQDLHRRRPSVIRVGPALTGAAESDGGVRDRLVFPSRRHAAPITSPRRAGHHWSARPAQYIGDQWVLPRKPSGRD